MLLALKIYYIYLTLAWSEKGVRLAQKMQVGPCIPVGIQLQKTAVNPTSGPTRRLSHLVTRQARVHPHVDRRHVAARDLHVDLPLVCALGLQLLLEVFVLLDHRLPRMQLQGDRQLLCELPADIWILDERAVTL